MKKYSGIFLSIFILLLIGFCLNLSISQAYGSIRIFVDDQEIQSDVSPQIINDRVLVPVRFIADALKAEVHWNESSKMVVINEGINTIDFTIGQAAHKNGQPLDLEVPAQLIDGRAMVPIRFISEAFGAQVKWNPDIRTVNISRSVVHDSLPTVDSDENLKQLLSQASLAGSNMRYVINETAQVQNNTEKSLDAALAGSPLPPNYSSTNVQVAGVDEADIVKTDGNYIYQVNHQRVIIARAYPVEELKIVSSVDFAGYGLSPQEIYVDDKHLVVIGHTSNAGPIRIQSQNNSVEICPPLPLQNTVKAIIFNIEDKTDIRKLREIELEGNYVSSRKIGASLYIIANNSIYYYPNQEDPVPLPCYRDTILKEAFIKINCPEIRYFPNFIKPNFLMVAGFNLEQPNEGVKVSTYLGAGENIYASTQNLYVAETTYLRDVVSVDENTDAKLKTLIRPMVDKETQVHRFTLSEGKATYNGSGKVPGTVLNQFSMDESDGYFRIATTKGDPWNSDEYTSKNNIYIMDPDLKVIGRIEDIAPGEKIYAVRFMGTRGYLVTFKNVDPLFVVDLKDPQNPTILGALKIPGYSDYLHPYDENHIIGFGKDSVEIAQKDWQGKGIDSTAFYMGMKIAIFDVSDVSNPIEMFSEKIGDRGTDSELLKNHKALFFSRDKNLLAFPITVMEIKDKANIPAGTSYPQYGTFAFQGAYIYKLDLVNGFSLVKKITHLTEQDYQKAGDYWYNSDKNVERIININDIVYTLSKEMLKAHNLSTLEEIATLPIN